MEGSAMKELHLLSLGAGVQSSTMALMAMRGEITPMPDAAIFADTGAEPRSVYEYLNWLTLRLPFPVYRVALGSLTHDQVTPIQTVSRYGELSVPYVRNLVPAFVLNEDGSKGMLQRKCTRNYKITPIRQKTRELWLAAGRPKVYQWIGISRDEASRMKPSGVKYIENRWPLLEKGMLRSNCVEWLERNDYAVPPKSACVYCPYHNDALWKEMRETDPSSFQAAVKFERDWNDALQLDGRPSRLRGVVRLHRSLVPLGDADFSSDEDRGQINFFNNECEGMCGV